MVFTNKYTVSDDKGEDIWMVQILVECEVCKKASIAHGTGRVCDKDHRASFAFLDTSRIPTAVRDKGAWICWDCQDAIYRPEAQAKVSNRRQPTD
tara:strand:+ start:76 stop:360 length:285 start_codon:yes stop_codon:yes gene_type:complete